MKRSHNHPPRLLNSSLESNDENQSAPPVVVKRHPTFLLNRRFRDSPLCSRLTDSNGSEADYRQRQLPTRNGLSKALVERLIFGPREQLYLLGTDRCDDTMRVGGQSGPIGNESTSTHHLFDVAKDQIPFVVVNLQTHQIAQKKRALSRQVGKPPLSAFRVVRFKVIHASPVPILHGAARLAAAC